MRLIYYAIGGGLGHLVRAKAFLQMTGLTAQTTVLTNSEFADDPRIVDGLNILAVPNSLQENAADFRAWLIGQIEKLNAECICIDVFPAGILGELCDLPDSLGVEFWHIARLLRWDQYAPLICGSAPRYTRVWRLEPLHPTHQQFLEAHCDHIEDIELIDAPMPEPIECADPFWLIVHSGPTSEVAEIIAYAAEIRSIENREIELCVASKQPPGKLPAATRILDVFPAQIYFAAAERIFSAAGFNMMRQMRAYRQKHVVLPMPRRYDDQFERARRCHIAQ
ncbi:hypothetical protein ELE36_13075 [Pseudolysobacter antarcticus]|uniref:Glycosyl transferase family 28 C-terminal domain-containing protein n=1 Tax=Pseudolysobacter antarcticus TaxID=2511995 RepID=A0A411HLD2_9GAMM|nr:hypothetical protein [Pseudolysobacter antarcticus]QBB71210.1 hypothetical protein ELE36_13075 [Pseudolysobacter antarcticus]